MNGRFDHGGARGTGRYCGRAFSFEKLRVYQRAEECLTRAYRVAAALPPAERFNLADKLRRVALSVVLNTAESTERRTAGDARHLLHVALGSLVETVACFRVAGRTAALPPALFHEARGE